MGLVVLRAGARKVGCLLVLTGCLTLGLLGLGAAQAHAATPSSLAGETFTATSGSVSGSCTSQEADDGFFIFLTSGTATGPYPGTFTEEGGFSMLNHKVTSFSAEFTITSPNGNVTGTKTLQTGGRASCTSAPLSWTIEGNQPSTFKYNATINGSYQDTGTATNGDISAAGTSLSTFSEQFTNSLTSTPPPTSKAQCKHGGWKSFGSMFKNQGDCVSYVATGGKNPPNG